MPFLLEQGQHRIVQLHMPRTGGTRLRAALIRSGARITCLGTAHCGPEVIPEEYESVIRVGTVRLDVEAWYASVRRFLREEQREIALDIFNTEQVPTPEMPTLGFWTPTDRALAVIPGFGSWYSSWTHYHYATVDRAIPTHTLPEKGVALSIESILLTTS